METSLSKLTVGNVAEVYARCQTSADDHSQIVMLVGPTERVVMSIARLREHEKTIWDLLAQIAHVFREPGGGSFSHFCMTSEGRVWSPNRRAHEMLLLLGLGINAVRYIVDPSSAKRLGMADPLIQIEPGIV